MVQVQPRLIITCGKQNHSVLCVLSNEKRDRRNSQTSDRLVVERVSDTDMNRETVTVEKKAMSKVKTIILSFELYSHVGFTQTSCSTTNTWKE